jgi:hypothetical protein
MRTYALAKEIMESQSLTAFVADDDDADWRMLDAATVTLKRKYGDEWCEQLLGLIAKSIDASETALLQNVKSLFDDIIAERDAIALKYHDLSEEMGLPS